MKKQGKIRPAPYSHTDGVENQAVATFVSLLDHEKVKADIKTRDKIPNIDGYLDLVDETFRSIGKVEAQIRKLSSIDPPKINVKASFLSYCESSILPVLLIGVDVKNKKAHWLYIDENFTSQLKIVDGQKSKTIYYSKENFVDGQNTKYIQAWKYITDVRRIKLQNYDELKKSYDILSIKSNNALGLIKNKFQNIHLFLDELNKLLDNEFSIVKRRYYPNAWRVGLAYYEYDMNGVSYTLYPIPLDKNDVQIKEVNEALRKQLNGEGLGFATHNAENPIDTRPKEYAKEVIKFKIMNLLENRLLNHQGNQFLANEFITGFIDKFHTQLGLQIKREYTTEEIERAFYHYLPIWMDEALGIIISAKRNKNEKLEDCFHRDSIGRTFPYFDPDDLTRQIMKNELDTIKHKVTERLNQEKINIPSLLIGNEIFQFGIFTEFFSFLKNQDIRKIERVYLPKDYSRIKRSGWDILSPEAIKKNLKVFFDNLPLVYNNLLIQNLPLLKDKLSLFGNVSKILIVFDVKEEYNEPGNPPTIQIIYLSNKEEKDINIEVFSESEEKAQIVSAMDFENSIEFSGRRYDIILHSYGVLDFIYKDLPMFNYVYKILEEKLKNDFDDSHSYS
jgi:hypothetical protein